MEEVQVCYKTSLKLSFKLFVLLFLRIPSTLWLQKNKFVSYNANYG